MYKLVITNSYKHTNCYTSSNAKLVKTYFFFGATVFFPTTFGFLIVNLTFLTDFLAFGVHLQFLAATLTLTPILAAPFLTTLPAVLTTTLAFLTTALILAMTLAGFLALIAFFKATLAFFETFLALAFLTLTFFWALAAFLADLTAFNIFFNLASAFLAT